MKINDNLAVGLTLGTSKIPNAGVGLFTTTPWMTGLPICEYKGDALLEGQIAERYQYTVSEMGFEVPQPQYAQQHPIARATDAPEGTSSLVYIDCHPTLAQSEIGLGAYINDKCNHENRIEKPLFKGDKFNQNKEKLKFLTDVGYNVHCYAVPTQLYFIVITLRDIEAGEELYLDYGDAYWEVYKNQSTSSGVLVDAIKNSKSNSPVFSAPPHEN